MGQSRLDEDCWRKYEFLTVIHNIHFGSFSRKVYALGTMTIYRRKVCCVLTMMVFYDAKYTRAGIEVVLIDIPSKCTLFICQNRQHDSVDVSSNSGH